MLDIETPVFSARHELMQFLTNSARRIYNTQNSFLKYPDVYVDLMVPQQFLEVMVIPMLLVAGWEKDNQPNNIVVLKTTRPNIVRQAFGGKLLSKVTAQINPLNQFLLDLVSLSFVAKCVVQV
jgi:hypothetical protein